MSGPVIRIENLRRTEHDGICRICAAVNGTEVWFESADVELTALPEVFASAFLVPAMAVGADLCVDGALASVAHALAGVSSVVISSSYAQAFAEPWGSHWQSDPLWSSGRMTVTHFGEKVLRVDKLDQISGNPLVQDHLRVCWKSRGGGANCCQCEKCVRTMIQLQVSGRLEEFRAFPLRHALPQQIRKVRYVTHTLLIIYDELMTKDLPPAVKRAMRRLLVRSRIRRVRRAVFSEVIPRWKRDSVYG